MKEWIGIAIGGMLGSVVRHGISRGILAVYQPSLPIATLIANFVGCFLVGVLFQFSQKYSWFSESTELALRVGFLGGLTTFSSFSLEVVTLYQQGRYRAAISILLANLALGLIGTIGGMLTCDRLMPPVQTS